MVASRSVATRNEQPLRRDAAGTQLRPRDLLTAAPTSDTVGAVVVTYHPDPDFAERAEAISRLVNRMVIVDNGSGTEAVTTLGELAGRIGANLIVNATNLGLAAALNQGCSWVRAEGSEWALVFDQDTTPLPALMDEFAAVYACSDAPESFAVIGSNYHEPTLGRTKFGFAAGTEPYANVRTVITSGSLLSLPVMEVIGPFREEFFIDHVDDEFCLRARSRGFQVVITREPTVIHAVGAPSLHRLPWKSYGTSNHSALRRYYMTRNHVQLIKDYLLKDPGWVLETAIVRVKSMLLMVAFEGERPTKLRYLGLGLWHGLLGRLGKL